MKPKYCSLKKNTSNLQEELLKNETEVTYQKISHKGDIFAIKIEYSAQITKLVETMCKIAEQLDIK